jgi:hypothetical protein
MTIQARRHNPRVCLNGTTYLNFSSGTSGVVLDVSQGGLRFKTSSPLPNAKLADFRFTYSGGGELLADLAWTDESRTVGALRFKSTSPEVHDQIRAWLGQSRETPRKTITGTEPTTVRPTPESAARSSKPAIFTEVQNVAEAKYGGTGNKSDNARGKIPEGKQHHLSIFHQERPQTRADAIPSPQQPRGRHRLAIAVIVILLLFGAATAAAAHFYPNEARDVITRAHVIVRRYLSLASKQRWSSIKQANKASGSAGGLN